MANPAYKTPQTRSTEHSTLATKISYRSPESAQCKNGSQIVSMSDRLALPSGVIFNRV